MKLFNYSSVSALSSRFSSCVCFDYFINKNTVCSFSLSFFLSLSCILSLSLSPSLSLSLTLSLSSSLLSSLPPPLSLSLYLSLSLSPAFLFFSLYLSRFPFTWFRPLHLRLAFVFTLSGVNNPSVSSSIP